MKKLLFILSLFITSNLFAQVNTGKKLYTKVPGGGSADLSNYPTKDELNDSLGAKIDTSYKFSISAQKPLRWEVVNKDSANLKINLDSTLNTSDSSVPTSHAVKNYVDGHSGSGTLTSVAKGYGILNDGTITTTGTITADSAALANYFPRRKDSTISFVTPYQSSLKQNIITNLSDTSKYVKKQDSTVAFVTPTQNYSKLNKSFIYTPFVISGDSLSQRFNVLAYNPNANDGSTDATLAIQSAINAAAAAGGGTIFFPNGTYVVNGPLVNSGAAGIGHPNSQIYIPIRGVNNIITIKLVGETPPSFAFGTGSNYTPSKSGAIIYSTISGSGVFPSILATDTTLFNVVNVEIDNLTFRVKANIGASGPTMSALNLHAMGQASVNNVMCDIDTSLHASVLPVAETFGIWMPSNNNGAFSPINNTFTGGYRYGTVLCEHSTGNNINSGACLYGVVMLGGYHGMSFGRICVQWCKYGVSGPVGTLNAYLPSYNTLPLNISHLDFEIRSPGLWYSNVYMIYDSLNLLRGSINYVITPRSAPTTIVRLGGDNITYTNLVTGVTSSVASSGTITGTQINATTQATATAPFSATNTATGSAGIYPWLFQGLTPNIPTGGGSIFLFGKALSNYNSAYFSFGYSGAGSTSNAMYVGFYGSNNLLGVLGSGNVIFQNGGTYTDNPAVQVQFNSTSQGILPPRLTTSQWNIISSKPEGLQAYDNVVHKPVWYNGTTSRYPLWTTDIIVPQVATVTSIATTSINAANTSLYAITAQAVALTIANPTGTPSDGQKLTIRIKDNGTAQTISFGSSFRFGSNSAAPTTTTISKVMYMEFRYDAISSTWDMMNPFNNF